MSKRGYICNMSMFEYRFMEGIGMKVLCLSAANVLSAKENSTSTKTCELVGNLLKNQLKDQVEVEVLPLLNYNMTSCIMCGKCAESKECIYDEGFNQVYEKLQQADGVVVVCPHYGIIPSKLTILLEKLEEFAFLSYCTGEEKFILSGKPIVIIGHGGQPHSEETQKYYQKVIVETLAQVFSAVQMQVVGIDENHPNGAAFGLKSIEPVEGEILPAMVIDWEKVSQVIAPLVNKLCHKFQE